jgi:hypothetical protein
MPAKPSLRISFTLICVAALLTSRAASGDSAPSIGAGGLEPASDVRLTVAKEVVHISDRKVTVEYDLRNDAATDLTTDLQFPVPPYKDQWDLTNPAFQAFRSFKAWADGKEIQFRTDAKADLDGRDITSILKKAKIDIPTFGHLELGRDQHNTSRHILVADYERLPEKEKKRLRNEGIFKGGEGYALYTVNLKYFWPQTIPAHATVHIRVEYAPVIGFTQIPADADTFKAELAAVSVQPAATTGATLAATANVIPAAEPGAQQNPLGRFCTDTNFIYRLLHAQKVFAESWGTQIVPQWVDFALTGDRGWHKPIGDFTLIIDSPQPEQGQEELVSFCSPGVVDKTDGDHLEVHLTNYLPGADLHIGFFNVPIEAQATPLAAK